MNVISLRPSLLPNYSGGDIDMKNQIPSLGLEENLDSEESFFTSEIVKGLYLRNDTAAGAMIKLENITISLRGALLDDTLPMDIASSVYLNNLTSEFSEELEDMFGTESPSSDFIDYLLERRLMNVPPFTPNKGELGFTSEDFTEVEERNAFSQWFKETHIYNSPLRTSMFGQIEVGLLGSQFKVLRSTEEVEGEDFYPSVRIPTLYGGDYWGFYLKMDMNFIPDWMLEKDFAYIYITWDQVTYELSPTGEEINTISTPKESQPIRIRVRATLGEIDKLVNSSIERMYGNYPPYFAQYIKEVQ